MKSTEIAKWEEIRVKGTLHFIVFGALRWGTTMLVTQWLVCFLIGKFDSPLYLEVAFEPDFIMLLIVICYGGGLFWAIIVWGWTEYDYQTSIGNNRKIPFWVWKQTDKLK